MTAISLGYCAHLNIVRIVRFHVCYSLFSVGRIANPFGASRVHGTSHIIHHGRLRTGEQDPGSDTERAVGSWHLVPFRGAFLLFTRVAGMRVSGSELNSVLCRGTPLLDPCFCCVPN
jgi:hypothetical protein